MKIAITGASGFLGRYVLLELQSRDLDVVDARRTPVASDARHPRTTQVQWDLADVDGVFERLGSPDVLIHLAWEGLPNYQSSRHLDTELPAQRRFLRSCVDQGLTRLAVAGTCFEYGLADGELLEEGPAAPVTQYGLAKQYLREDLAALEASARLQLTWCRFFYLYGAGQAPSALYSQLLSAIDKGLPVFNMSGGAQKRDFLPVAEAARLFTTLALGPSTGTINVCSGRPVTVSSLVEHWVAEHNAAISLNKGYYPYATFEPMAFWGSRAKLDAILRSLRDPAT